MKKLIFFLILLSFACKDKTQDTQAIEQEQEKLVQQQISDLDFSKVDEYPAYSLCPDSLSQEDKLQCFQVGISRLFNDALSKHNLATADALTDTIKVFLKIDNEGKIHFERSESSEKTRELLPQLDSILSSEASEIEPVIPAKKHNVNVVFHCQLPLVINAK